MPDDQTLKELLSFFRVLSEENRLKIIGVLTQKSANVEEIASLLGISVSTASHHLARLAEVGLVSARTEGHYYYYSFQGSVYKQFAEKLLHLDTLPELSEQIDMDAYDRKVLGTFLGEDGRINHFPAKEKKFQVLLRYVLKSFEPGIRYPEKRVNDILSKFNDDTATLRRGLVEYHLMERQGGGGEYWVADQVDMGSFHG